MLRRRGFRVFILIAVIVALSLAALSFRDVHIPLIDLDRTGSGPLGLTLGLDLKGGSHLMYQANLPDQVQVTFEDEVLESDLRTLLDERDQRSATIAKRRFSVAGISFLDAELARLRQDLDSVAPVNTFGTGDRAVTVTFLRAPGLDELHRALERAGYPDATVVSGDDGALTIAPLLLEEASQDRLRTALEDLSPLQSLDIDDGTLDVTFRDALDEEELRVVLGDAGHDEATIESPSQTSYTIGELTLDDLAAAELRTVMAGRLPPIGVGGYLPTINEPKPDDMKGVVDIIQRRINALGTTEPIIQTLGEDRIIVQLPGIGGSAIDVAFQSIPSMLFEIVNALEGMGYTGSAPSPAGGTSYIIRTNAAVAQEDVAALGDLVERLAPGTEFEASEGDPQAITVIFPPPPSESRLAELITELGHSDFTVQDRGGGSFIIRADDAVTTEVRDEIQDALEAEIGEIVVFQATGGIEEAKQLIGQTAELVFKERECLVTLAEVQINPGACRPIELGGDGRYVDKDLGLTGRDLARAFPGSDPTTNEHEVVLHFRGRGAAIWSDVTRRLVGDQLKRIAIFLDDRQITAPVVSGHSPDGRTRITGRFTREEARTLAIQLESGRLPVPLSLIREGTVDALLGADSLRKSLIAGLVGLGLVLVFMVAYYRAAGLVAGASLLIYGVIVLAIFKMIPITLTLSGIAGIVLSIGFAVDANILIFERMKEELRTGRSLTSSMEVGFRRAWVAIRDSNVSTIITGLILFLFGSRLGGGTPVVTGFAVTLLIGVIVSMFTAIMVSRNLLQILALTPFGRRMDLFTPEPKRQPVGVAGGEK